MRHILPLPSFLLFQKTSFYLGLLSQILLSLSKYQKGTLRNECIKRGNLLITFPFFVCQEKWNKMFLIKLRERSLVQSRRLDIRLWKSFTILSPFLAFFCASKGKKGGKLFASFTPKNFDV